MTKFVVIATANRGALETFEPLDASGQRLASRAVLQDNELDDARDRKRIAAGYVSERDPVRGLRRERDPHVSWREEAALAKPPEQDWDHFARMAMLARVQREMRVA
jgi:hypothetical protein